MSMGAQWKHAGRIGNAAKRGALVSKLVKEITVAARTGDSNPENNPRLRAAVEAARKASVTRETIERAVSRGSGADQDGIQLETIVYEGFAPHNIAVIVECLTENRNRTNSDIKVLFRKGQLGSVGSVGWMFRKLGIIEAHHPDKTLDLESVAIEIGAQEVEKVHVEGDSHVLGARFLTEVTDLDLASKALMKSGWKVTTSELGFQAKDWVELDPARTKDVVDFLDAIDDNDDVHRIYMNLSPKCVT